MEVSGQLHASAAVPPREKQPIQIGLIGWVVPIAGLDTAMKRNESLLPPRIELRSSNT
jgi:hypothetical protein